MKTNIAIFLPQIPTPIRFMDVHNVEFFESAMGFNYVNFTYTVQEGIDTKASFNYVGYILEEMDEDKVASSKESNTPSEGDVVIA